MNIIWIQQLVKSWTCYTRIKRLYQIAIESSGKHVTVVKNDADETAIDSMMRVLNESANEVLEETMNLILAATRMVDFKRIREKN
ncbi:hypothetical protein KY284_001226 [Solanum tuberosum]|nr:hypothetical protein KY284_001226 [Solanum tuberosum]